MQLGLKVYECDRDGGYYVVRAGVTAGNMFHDFHIVTDKPFEIGESIQIDFTICKTTAEVECRPYDANRGMATMALYSGTIQDVRDVEA